MMTALSKLARYLTKFPLTLAVGSAALVVASVPGMSEALEYNRTLISAGEFWLTMTCHLVHWNAEHLQWDLLMFLVLGGLCESRNPKTMRLCVLGAAAAVSATVFLTFPNVNEYRGLSGIDTALFTVLAIQLFSQARRERSWRQAWVVGALFVGFMAKTAYEGIAGQTIFVDEATAGFMPLVWDHVTGAVVGALVAMGNLAGVRLLHMNTAGQASSGTPSGLRREGTGLFADAP